MKKFFYAGGQAMLYVIGGIALGSAVYFGGRLVIDFLMRYNFGREMVVAFIVFLFWIWLWFILYKVENND